MVNLHGVNHAAAGDEGYCGKNLMLPQLQSCWAASAELQQASLAA